MAWLPSSIPEAFFLISRFGVEGLKGFGFKGLGFQGFRV